MLAPWDEVAVARMDSDSRSGPFFEGVVAQMDSSARSGPHFEKCGSVWDLTVRNVLLFTLIRSHGIHPMGQDGQESQSIFLGNSP